VSALGVDETAFLAANGAHHTVFVTGIVDLSLRPHRPARLLDVVQGRTGTALSDRVSAQPASWRAGIEVAALDPFRGYATALAHRAAGCGPGARRLSRHPARAGRRR